MARRSGRARKAKELSPEPPVTPSKRSSRQSTRRKKESSESEKDASLSSEGSASKKSTRTRTQLMATPSYNSDEETNNSAEEESEGLQKNEKNGDEPETPSTRRRTKHSSKSEDSDSGKKSRNGRNQRQKQEEEEEEGEVEAEEAVVEEVEEENKEEEETEVSATNNEEEIEKEESDAEDEANAEESEKDNEEAESNETVDKEGETSEREDEPEQMEQASSEEEEEEESRSNEEQVSTEAAVPEDEEEDKAQESDEGQGEQEQQEEEEEDDDDNENEKSLAKENTEDQEDGEIAGSPPMWTGEKRTWGLSKCNNKLKFMRSKQAIISTSVLQELHTFVKPFASDVLEKVTKIHIEEYSSEGEEVKPDEALNQNDLSKSQYNNSNNYDDDYSADEKENKRGERIVKIKADHDGNETVLKKRKSSDNEEEHDDIKNTSTRKVSVVKEPRTKTIQLVPSNVLFIYNLTRPFTLGQLKELLSRTGKIMPDGFWIDAIKSKCFVEYESEEQAEETRHALHEVRWPVTNHKVLKVEFSSKDAMLNAQIKAEAQEEPKRKTEPLMMETDADRKIAVREWDMGKVADEEKHRRDRDRDERDKDKRSRKDRRRSSSLDRSEPDVRKRKKDIEAPAKLLDDLFKKTKTTPCLYWLPLTSEQIAVKEEIRKKHLAELEKRMKTTAGSSSNRNRDRRR